MLSAFLMRSQLARNRASSLPMGCMDQELGQAPEDQLGLESQEQEELTNQRRLHENGSEYWKEYQRTS